MFPNPQDALPLPPRPSLERYKKLAKGLVRACKSGDDKALRKWAEEWVRAIAKLSNKPAGNRAATNPNQVIKDVYDFIQRKMGGATNGKACALTAAQFVLARSHGFESWPRLSKHLQALAQKDSATSRFEQAADAIVNGDVASLKRLLREDSNLVQAKSVREHGATLLHYVSANGVEGYRQKTPKNIVEITEMLLNVGSEIDATARMYGGQCTTLGLAATSCHPEHAGVQEALLQTLLDCGASTEQHGAAGNDQLLITACLANGQPRAAELLARCGAPIDLAGAAGMGRLDIIRDFFDEKGNWKQAITKKQLEAASFYACGYGREKVVEFLLDKGMDLAAHGGDGQTPLHWAVIGGHLHIVNLLLRHKAPLELKNMYGGTVLGQTLWSAAHGGDPDTYISILHALVAAGAKIPERHVPVNPQIDVWLAQRGSRA